VTYFFLEIVGVIDLVRVVALFNVARWCNCPVSRNAVKSSDDALYCLRGTTGLLSVILMTGDKLSTFDSCGDDSLSEMLLSSSSLSTEAIPLSLFDSSCIISVLSLTFIDE